MKKVVVIEDDAACRRIVEIRLRRWGCRVLMAVTGPEGAAITLRERPDLVLLDLSLPGLDGGGVLDRIRGNPETANVPVIILTAQNARDRVVDILRRGVSGYLVKPFAGAAFDREVGKVLDASAGTTAGPRPVAVVGDADAGVRAAVRDALEGPLAVVEASRGDEVVDRFDELAPRVLLLDMLLPGMSGPEVAKHLRWFRAGDFRLLALSAEVGPAIEERAQRAGFEAVVQKPVNPTRLVAHVLAAANAPPRGAVERLLGRHGGCRVLALPQACADRLVGLAPEIVDELVQLGGEARLVIDASEVDQPTVAAATFVTDLVRGVEAAGLRVGISARAGFFDVLRALGDTRHVPCAETVAHAAALLGDAGA